jgi:hypothetical protein
MLTRAASQAQERDAKVIDLQDIVHIDPFA